MKSRYNNINNVELSSGTTPQTKKLCLVLSDTLVASMSWNVCINFQSVPLGEGLLGI